MEYLLVMASSALITGGFTALAFWLGVKSQADDKVLLQDRLDVESPDEESDEEYEKMLRVDQWRVE